MSQGPGGLKSPAGEGRAGPPGLDARRDPGGDRRWANGLGRDSLIFLAIDVLTGGLPLEDELLTNTLVWLLATCPDDKLRDGTRAVRYALQLCPQVSQCRPTYLDTLAAALAEARRFKEAAEIARQALQQARESGDDDLSGSIGARPQLYEAGKPYHQPRP